MAKYVTLDTFCDERGLTKRVGLVMIHSRQLPAYNFASAGAKSGKPRWRILIADAEAFDASRAVKPAVKPEPRKVQRKPDSGTIQFFKNGKRVTS